jgi:hypothetical protein
MFSTLIVILLFPFWIMFLLLRNKDKLNTKEFKALYLEVYAQIKFQKGDTWTLLEPSITTLRMLLTCGGLLFL